MHIDAADPMQIDAHLRRRQRWVPECLRIPSKSWCHSRQSQPQERQAWAAQVWTGQKRWVSTESAGGQGKPSARTPAKAAAYLRGAMEENLLQ